MQKLFEATAIELTLFPRGFREGHRRWFHVLRHRMIRQYGVTATIRYLGLAIGFLQIKIAGDFFDHLSRNGFGVFDERADQGMFTKQIDNPGNASGMAMHNFNCRWAEDLPSPVAG